MLALWLWSNFLVKDSYEYRLAEAMPTLASMERDKENGWVLRRTMEVSW